MKTKQFSIGMIGLIALAVIFPNSVVGQAVDKAGEAFIDQLPAGLQLKENEPQHYLMVTTHYNRDMYGSFINKSQVSGEYTRGLEGGKVKWNHARIVHSQSQKGDFGEGTALDFMENFSYVPSEKILEPSFFQGFPNDQTSLMAKNLVWDMSGIEALAWICFDSLSLNQEYLAKEINGEADLAGAGTFTNEDIRLTWKGLTKTNDKLCAVIDFTAYNNPLEIDMQNFKMKGRSHYWGTIYVSLTDKQIEYASMHEDVMMDMNSNMINAFRMITVTKK